MAREAAEPAPDPTTRERRSCIGERSASCRWLDAADLRLRPAAPIRLGPETDLGEERGEEIFEEGLEARAVRAGS